MISVKSAIVHLAVWGCVFAAWLLATRQYHSTWPIALLATGVLVSAAALAVYLNRSLRVRRAALGFGWWRYGGSLLAGIALLDLGAVLLIQFIYDQLWGPDPNRFGFWFNVGSDGAIITLHVAAEACSAWGMLRVQK